MSVYLNNAKDLISKQQNEVDELLKKKIEEVNKQQGERIAAAEQSVEEQKLQNDRDYVDLINAADLQKELDLRNIRETRANMGLARSGLSATEQTAAVLSAGNKVSKAQLQRQAAIDALNKSLADYKIEAEDTRRSNILSLEEAATKEKSDYAQKAYNDAYDAEQEAISAANKTRELSLKALYNDGNGSINADTYARAIANGWTIDQAKAYQNYQKEFSTAVENGVIDQGTADAALEGGYTLQYAEAVYNRNKQLESFEKNARSYFGTNSSVSPQKSDAYTETTGAASSGNGKNTFTSTNTITSSSETPYKTIDQATLSQRLEALGYLYDLIGNGLISTTEADAIAGKIGFTNAMLQQYYPILNAAKTENGGLTAQDARNEKFRR